MAYCHECGEQVAEIDIFCPHCGISLQPVALPDEDEDSPENTIAFTHSEIAESRGAADSASDPEPVPAKSEEILQPIVQPETSDEPADSAGSYFEPAADKTEEAIDLKTEDYSNPVTEENINLRTE